MPLHRKTTLVLGAGASTPYNYPTGRDLQDCLITPSGELSRMLRNLRHSDSAVQEVSKYLGRYQGDSIDEFLVRYPEYSAISKHAIAYEIIRRENIDTQLRVCQDNWYRFLYLKVLDDDPMLKSGLLRIVTFNYDLSIDAHIHESLKVRHKLDDKQAADRMKSLGLIHVYGHVGPVQAFHGIGRNFGRPPGEAPTSIEVDAAASGIGSIADPQSAAAWDSALSTIAEAEDLVFIGFGWGTENVRRLNLRETAKDARRIVATTVGILDLNSIRECLPVGPEFSHVITAARQNPTADMIQRLFTGLCESN